jgi:hypothetical protein
MWRALPPDRDRAREERENESDVDVVTSNRNRGKRKTSHTVLLTTMEHDMDKRGHKTQVWTSKGVGMLFAGARVGSIVWISSVGHVSG